MTENLNIHLGEKFIDKTITRSGTDNFKKLNVSCYWELHALPEYMNNSADLKLSCNVIIDLASYLKKKGVTDTTIKIAEGYSNKKIGKEHFRLKIVFGKGNDTENLIFSRQYSANTDHGEIKGIVRSIIGLSTDSMDDYKTIEEKVAEIYIKEMETVYSDWVNQWEEGKFSQI